MYNPFVIRDDEIHDRDLHDTPQRQWLEGVAPSATSRATYLKTALRRTHIYFGLGIFFSVLLLLSLRSAQLQIVKRKEYRAAADANRMRIERIHASRGEIIDRNGVTLTRNVPRFQVILNSLELPRNNPEREIALRTVSDATAVPFDELKVRLVNLRPPVSPIVLSSGLTLDEVYPLLVNTQGVSGISAEIISTREYIGGTEFAHILGYVGPIAPEQKDQYLAAGYLLNELIGQTGIEAALENTLRGADGRRYVEVDAVGQVKTVLAQEEATAGAAIKLTIDAELQRAAAQSLRDALAENRVARGAVIVLDPQSGEILTLVSLPDYDNNLFTVRSDQIRFDSLFSNPDNPLFPRAIAGTYPSGSTIKPALAASALQERVITPRSTYLSAGGLRVGQWFFPDWKAGGHGLTDVRKALAESVNTFFYILGGGYNDLPGLGIEKLADYLGRFGFGKLTGIEIPGEAAGLVATPQWKEEMKSEQWYIGDTYHMAIGQGDLLVTPLQIARMTAYFASGGKWTQPRLTTPPLTPPHGGGEADPQIDPEYIRVVREGLRDAVRYGSSRALQALPLTSAGKTGTAQWSSVKDTHAWFTGWAPYENPEISVTVLIEEGGEGSQTAVPVARQIFEWWYTNRMENK